MSIQDTDGDKKAFSTVSHGGVQDFQTHAIAVVQIPSLLPSAAYSPSYAQSQTFKGTDIQTSSPEQFAKLQWYFNMFEEFKLSKVVIKWHPRWNVAGNTGMGLITGSLQSNVTTLPFNPQNSNPASGGPYDMASQGDIWRFMLVPDHNDIIVRSGTTTGAFDEVLQVALQDDVCWHSSHHAGPDLVLEPSLWDVSSIVDPQTTGAALSNQVLYNDNERMKWLPTKITLQNPTTTPPTFSLQLATNINFLGIKYYLWNPMVLSSQTSGYSYPAVPIGWLSYKYYWNFRKLDNRSIINSSIELEKRLSKPSVRFIFGDSVELINSANPALDIQRLEHPGEPFQYGDSKKRKTEITLGKGPLIR